MSDDDVLVLTFDCNDGGDCVSESWLPLVDTLLSPLAEIYDDEDWNGDDAEEDEGDIVEEDEEVDEDGWNNFDCNFCDEDLEDVVVEEDEEDIMDGDERVTARDDDLVWGFGIFDENDMLINDYYCIYMWRYSTLSRVCMNQRETELILIDQHTIIILIIGLRRKYMKNYYYFFILYTIMNEYYVQIVFFIIFIWILLLMLKNIYWLIWYWWIIIIIYICEDIAPFLACVRTNERSN